MAHGQKWIGVDLDGTLAFYEHWVGRHHIGAPIPAMMARVKGWLAQGQMVKIFTARAGDLEAIPYIRACLNANGLPELEITNVKDFDMIQLWDDRAVQVEKNTGRCVSINEKPVLYDR